MTGSKSTSTRELAEVKELAIVAARRAGAILLEMFGQITQVRYKGTVDLVTEADLACEREIIRLIKEQYPQDRIVAEESANSPGPSTEPCWVIDPLDGTTNFVHGLPIFAVSIAWRDANQTMVGVVYNPVADEQFVAVSGAGATLNGVSIHVSSTNKLEQSLLVTGFPYDHDTVFERSFELFHAYYSRCQGVRRLGAAALDMCYVAAGRLDAYYEAHLKPWDICAGDLICREAGGHTSDWHDGPLPYDGRRVLATNNLIHAQMLQVLTDAGFDDFR